MNFRLRTSKYTADRLKQLQASTNITPNILARLAVSLSLQQGAIDKVEIKDTAGIEFNRTTLTGEFDDVYRAAIAQHSGREVKDEEYFPELFNMHLERGVRLLFGEYKYAGNYEKFIINLLSK
ncbi:DNA sulfur modification protein [Aneurinibacillus migulanus]|uniref:DNA sulfur modification protein DndE n=1 Tax=Aneurinibacillus migulanus TaxID=47500 RepID=UPI0005B7A16A|nr:DNA sulfur modification protein DndE [Aneurinibacillus migulanus]KIV56068.1 DNA sulfur modification protein [Aneurinibacillus migulanus]KPD06592.1 DNA sulfur modification protein [Aneurinibacillus migulanus]